MAIKLRGKWLPWSDHNPSVFILLNYPTMNLRREYQAFLQYWKVLGLLVISFGCTEAFDLNEDPGRSQSVALPYQDLGQLEEAVIGMYSQVWRTFRMNQAFAHTWGADDITTGPPCCKITITEFDRLEATADNSALSSDWQNVYNTVRTANTILEHATMTDLPDRIAQDRLIGEVFFLRGLLFQHLARKHGRIPLVLEIQPDHDISLATQVEVYQQIESDFLQAEAMLPASSNVGATRPNSGTARAFLARLYLDWAGFPVKDHQKYQQAATSAKLVIDQASEHGFSLVDDMASLYTVAGTRNPEGVFTVASCNSCGLGNRKHGTLGLPSEFGGWHETFAEIRFFEDFPEGYRKEVTFHTEVPVNAQGRIISNVAEAESMVPWTSFRSQKLPLYKKIVGPWEEGTFEQFQSSRGDYLMRFAEVLLIYAEASGRAGSVTAAAWEALNKVRRRAEGLPPDQADPAVDILDGDIAELAYTERKWELAGEYLRWFDLVRLERVEAALGGSARDPRESTGTRYFEDGSSATYPITRPAVKILGSLGTDNYFYPIPASEVRLLPQLGE